MHMLVIFSCCDAQKKKQNHSSGQVLMITLSRSYLEVDIAKMKWDIIDQLAGFEFASVVFSYL